MESNDEIYLLAIKKLNIANNKICSKFDMTTIDNFKIVNIVVRWFSLIAAIVVISFSGLICILSLVFYIL